MARRGVDKSEEARLVGGLEHSFGRYLRRQAQAGSASASAAVGRETLRTLEAEVVPICREIRAAYDLPEIAKAPLSETELELVWGVNSRVFYFGVRKYVYGMPVPEDLDSLIEAEVNTFFDGIGSTLMTLFPTGRTPAVLSTRARRSKTLASAR